MDVDAADTAVCINDALPIETVTAVIAMLHDDVVPVMVFPCALVCRQWRDIVMHVRRTRDKRMWNCAELDCGLIWRELTVDMAVFDGYVELLRWLVDDVHIQLGPGADMHCESRCNACVTSNCKYHCVHNIDDCRWSDCNLYELAIIGDMDMLKYLSEKGIKWDETVCYGLAEYGNLEFLKYARTLGCPWNYHVYDGAMKSGSWNIIGYASANGCPLHPENEEDAPLTVTAARCDINMLKWAHGAGIPMVSDVYPAAVRSRNLAAFEYAYESKCAINVQDIVCEINRTSGFYMVIPWMVSHNIVCMPDIIRITAKNGCINVLKYLQTKITLDYNLLCIYAVIKHWHAKEVVRWVYAQWGRPFDESRYRFRELLEDGLVISTESLAVIAKCKFSHMMLTELREFIHEKRCVNVHQ